MMYRRLAALSVVAGAALLFSIGSVLGDEAERIAKALDAVREAAADRDLPAVQKGVADLETLSAGRKALDEARVLLGKTYLGARLYAEAGQAVAPLLDAEDGAYRTKALYLTAEAAALRRDWKQAADIYARRVEYAASEPHALEVAALYREIADGAYLGDLVIDGFGRETRVPDWRTALEHYGRARALAVPEAERAEVDYRIGKCLLETGRADLARDTWSKLLGGGAGDFADDALYGKGVAEMRLSRLADARATFAELRETFGDSPFAPLALIRSGESWVQAGLNAETLRQALVPWRKFLELYPRHEEAAGLAFKIAETQTTAGRPRDAVESYRSFLAAFPEDDRAVVAQDRVARSFLDLGEFDQAVREWQTLLAKWPSHALWAEAQRNVALATFLKGSTAYEREDDAAAKIALAAFLESFPVDPRAPEAQFLLGEIAVRAKDHAGAVAAWTLVTSKYPASAQAPAAALRIAALYEGVLADLEKALAAYEEIPQRWPGSAEAGTARSILAQMKGRTLDVTVRRAFRTDEQPAVKMRLRNTPRLRMKAYRVDPAEYVTRKGGLAGVENVEVDIVKPDQAWDFDVPDYAKYRLLERDCPLPIKGAGAYIVTAAEEELTATFFVLVSDLTTIVKSAPGQALVFVFDERTGQPVRGARVRLLDGDARGVTGEDGVFVLETDAPSRVRAVVEGADAHAGHFAFTDGSAGQSAAFGYSSKVLLHTDRPLYRPGDTVAVRGIARRVAEGRYVTPEGLKLRLSVTDPRGATLLDQDVTTDAFGVFSQDLELTSEPSLGTYRVQTVIDGRTYDRTFDVLAYKKPDVLVDVTPGKSTYLVGDEVTAKASMRFRVGGAVRGAAVRWTVYRGPFTFDASLHEAFSWFFRDAARDEELRRRQSEGMVVHDRGEAQTDVDGSVEITFRPDVVEEDRTYTLVVEAQDPNRRWVSTSTGVPVTQRGAYVICRTEKKVYLPRERMLLEVTTVNPLHVPLALTGEAVLVRRRLVDQHFVEDEVARVAATTDAQGRAGAALTAELPGDYVARFEAKDERGNLVVGETPVTLAGAAEDLAKQAKLVADREFYREGDVAKVLVNVPVVPSPVLITYEGERVFEHRVFMATERSTTLELPLTARDAPNVFLRMAVAKDGELYEDGDEVAVFRYLDVKVRAGKEVYRPGEPVEITVETTDQSGKPIEAVVSVDVVDAGIYQLAVDATPQAKPFFYDQRRTHAVTTASSAATVLPTVTRPTNPDLLFEQMRRLGKEKFEEMQEHVFKARKLFEEGKAEEARKELGSALEIAPGNYEARALLDSLDSRNELAKDKSGSLRRDAPEKSADAKKRPAASPKPQAPTADAAAREPADSPFEGEGTNGTIGIGGGAGGAFGGRRGGSRSLRARGGGGKDASKSDEDANDDEAPSQEADRQQQGGGFEKLAERLGELRRVTLSEHSAASVFLAQDAAPLVPAALRERFLDTAVTAPSVRTGKDGRGKLEFTLPDNLTEWRITARGSGRESLVGDGRGAFRSEKRILIRTDVPRFLTDGDAVSGTGTIHVNTPEAVDATVRFAATGAKVEGEAERTLHLDAGEVRPVDVKLATEGHGLASLRADVLTSVESDAQSVGLPVIPYGVREISGASGLLSEEAFTKLLRPETPVDGTVRLLVTLSPSTDLALYESLAYTSSYPWGCVEQTVNRFLPALAARRALEKSGSWNAKLKEQLDRSVERGLAALYSMQRDDGSFGWFGPVRRGDAEMRGQSSVENTSYAVLGMLRAEQAGYRVSTSNRDRALAALEKLMVNRPAEEQCFALYALAEANRADLANLTRLQRSRDELNARSLALLALAMNRTGRPGNALECVNLLTSKAQRDQDFVSWDAVNLPVRYHRYLRRVPVDVEPTAYALLAIIAVEPENPLVDGAARWLASNRIGPAWRSTRDTAAAIEALSAHLRLRGVQRVTGDVQVFLNDGAEPVGTAHFGGGADAVDAPVTIDVPATALVAGENRLILRRKGAGEVRWSALLACVVKPEGDGPIKADPRLFRVDREYLEWVRPPLPGEKPFQRVVAGWSIVEPKERPAEWNGRRLRRVGTGDKVRVNLSIRPYESVERVILEDPLPAGFEVVTGSAEGGFDREERRDDRQVFFFSRVAGTMQVSYVLQAIHPGSYRALPATAHPMYEPEIHGRSDEARVTIEPTPGLVGAPPSAEEITPDEIWALALRAYDDKDWTAARQGIESVMKQYKLLPNVLEEADARLFVIGIELGDDALAVKSYESLLERNPRRRVTDTRLRRLLARAFQGLGEHERALTLYRDLVREAFALDKGAADAFAGVGDPWRRMDLWEAALAQQPDASWTAMEELNLARELALLRAPVPSPTGADGKPVTRVPRSSPSQPLLLHRAVRRLRAFEAHFADSELAHEAGYLCVRSLVDMHLAADAIAEGARFLRRHPESRYLDDVTYLVAEGHFQAGDYDAALAAARPLLSQEFPRDDDPGKTAISPFRAQAIHLTAKVAHLRGDLDRAVALYREVEGLFPDALDARTFLTRTGLKLREVEDVGVGTTPRLHMSRKNVPEVRLAAYAVDFMILYALRRDLSQVNRIDLSGVKPAYEWVVQRRGKEDYQWHDEEVELPVKDKGVYLVVARGGNLDASSVVLVSDLQIDVQETNGRLRIYATERASGAPMGEVYVKIGDGRQIKAQGFTDARGVFEVGGVGGSFSVVAEKDGHVALWRR